MNKKIKNIVIYILVIMVAGIAYFLNSVDNSELRTIRSDKELYKIYNGGNSEVKEILTRIVTMPFSFSYTGGEIYLGATNAGSRDSVNSISSKSANSTSSKDYSTTNIQVENVDEADITKTDGDYIYSISEDNVIITNVMNPEEIKIEATIKARDGSIPEDLILYKDKLVVISENSLSAYYTREKNTIVKIYNISEKSNPTVIKSYELYEPYYTSRCINNELYIIASGDLREDDDKVVRTYKEDKFEKEIALENIKYLKDVKTDEQTIISICDLDNVTANIDIKSYLIDISNAYVSEKSIYLLEQKHEYEKMSVAKIFGIKGIMGLFPDDYTNGYNTEIYKFDISEDGKVSYKAKNKIPGKTINQYSLDEQDGHFRVALYDEDGARVAIFDENLNQIGISEYVAKGERMYSSRFMGNKAYLVTYRTIDPLFVIDLSNETKPQVLGELHIPGYSTYLHPYDENHLIGIGMETGESINKDSSGKVTSTRNRIIGMKMALFDVSDVNNPIQLSQTVIGDRRTTSAVLTNPKALLFSKEKQLIAIPVNNYNEDFEVTTYSSVNDYSSMIREYTNYNKPVISEGYFVYKINVEDGFNLKGVITHEISQDSNNQSSYRYKNSKLLRGLYIDNNLYTVSETAVKVNNLDSLELISQLKIK